MNITNFFKHIAERNKERRRQEMEQRAHDFITTELDAQSGILYVCVGGIRVHKVTKEKVSDIFAIPFADMGAYITTIRREYLNLHGYGNK